MEELKHIYRNPKGFRSAAIHAGIKTDSTRKDMTLVVSECIAAVAGVFTRNKVKAAPVKWSTQQVTQKYGRAVVANSGNANACTGDTGTRDAQRMAELTASLLDLIPEEVSVCSTGCIGVPLPMKPIEEGINALIPALRQDDTSAPSGILTSDTREKVATIELEIDQQHVCITAMAKGAGMIEPNMATMLCFITTDAALDPSALQSALTLATDQSFNRITVDGDMSTNDTVLILANGMAGNQILTTEHPQWSTFTNALNQLTLDLAMQIVEDGEGTSKVITLEIQGAASDRDADTAARAIANSLLVKTAWAGNYPVWGRIMDVLGYADIALEESRVHIMIGDTVVTKDGLDAGSSATEVLEITSQKAYTIAIGLGLGPGTAVVYTTDCTEEYVRLNMV